MSALSPAYLFDPREGPSLPLVDVPLDEATPENVAGYGQLVHVPGAFDIEIVQWPAQGWRPIDDGTGNEGGLAEGVFQFEWGGRTAWA